MSRPRHRLPPRDVFVAAGLGALLLVEIWAQPEFAGDRAAASVTAVTLTLSLAFARRLPLIALAAAVGAIELSNLAAPALADTPAFWLGFAFAGYCAGRYTQGRSWVAAVLMLGVAVPLAAVEPGHPFRVADAAYVALLLVAPLVVGRVIGRRRQRESELERRAETLDRERHTMARAAVAQERARIARELHDVVAHALSVMVLQARGARHVLATQPDEARRSLDSIEHAGEQALAEMRTLLGLLRGGDDSPPTAPQPRLERIHDLVADVTASGLPVDVAIQGQPMELPLGIDVSAYRIVQEALTNALKHAGPAHARVIVRYGGDRVELEIVDDGVGVIDGSGSGHGLTGIRERVAIYNGELDCGRRPEGGYSVRVRLPVPARR
jgi:signal transduction histidine kinase